MAFVYILQSLKNGRYYIGSTNNLERRFAEHNKGLSRYTKSTKPFKLVFKQEFSSLSKAREIEYKLKSFKSKKIIEKIINEKIIKLN